MMQSDYDLMPSETSLKMIQVYISLTFQNSGLFVSHVLQYKVFFIVSRFFIRYAHNYTEYNQQWHVSQVRSMDSAIIWNTNTREYT